MANESMKLTPKQEAFCLAYMETGNASEAYRRAYDAAAMSPVTINRSAKELLDNRKITARVSDLRMAAVKRNEVTVDDLLIELEEARKTALTAPTPQSGAAVSATMGKAKLLGFGTDKLHVMGELTIGSILSAMDGESGGLPEA